jgi:hypothetical protein
MRYENWEGYIFLERKPRTRLLSCMRDMRHTSCRWGLWLTQVYYLFKYFLYCYILSFFWVKKTLKKKKITSSYFTPLTHGLTHCWRPRIGIEWTDHCLLRWLIAGPKKNYRKYKSAHLVCSYHVLSLYGRLKWCGFDIILLPVDSEKRI